MTECPNFEYGPDPIVPWPMRLAGLLLFAAAMAVSAPTGAQSQGQTGTIAEEIVGCAGIADDSQRLRCFDRVAAPLLADGAGDPEEAALVFLGEDGDWTSDVLTLDRPWHLAWQSTAVQMVVELRNADGHLVSVAATQVGEGDGQSDKFDPGDYRLNVRAVNGEWRLHLIED